MTKQSRYPYTETIAKLTAAMIQGGNTVFAQIDQAAAAETVALSLRPTTLIVFGNPKGGTPFMDAFPLVGLELPLKLLVWDDGTHVSVAYVPMSEIAARHGVTGLEERIAAIDRGLEALASIVA